MPRRRHGFTIVELLVVISIIAVLMGLLLPAVNGARRRAKKLEETNYIRQVGIAWELYSGGNNDQALPGYLDASGTDTVQDKWSVSYLFPTKELVEPEDAASWPWRLMRYLDYNHDCIYGYRDEAVTDPQTMSDYDGEDENRISRPVNIARAPAFGYNAYYCGGWWSMDETNDRALPRFNRVKAIIDDVTQDKFVPVVARSVSNIRNTTQFVLFCSSARLAPGEYRGKVVPDLYGSHYVTPRFLAEELQWEAFRTSEDNFDQSIIQVHNTSSAPIARYTDQAAVLHADLHIAPHQPGELEDQRYWINAATHRSKWKHTDDQ